MADSPEMKKVIEEAIWKRDVDTKLKRDNTELIALRSCYERLEKAIGEIGSKVDTAAEVARATADKTMSTKTFLLGCAGVVASLGAILAGTGHA